MISDLTLADIDGLDNILEFIEVKKDEKVSKRKRKLRMKQIMLMKMKLPYTKI